MPSDGRYMYQHSPANMSYEYGAYPPNTYDNSPYHPGQPGAPQRPQPPVNAKSLSLSRVFYFILTNDPDGISTSLRSASSLRHGTTTMGNDLATVFCSNALSSRFWTTPTRVGGHSVRTAAGRDGSTRTSATRRAPPETAGLGINTPAGPSTSQWKFERFGISGEAETIYDR